MRKNTRCQHFDFHGTVHESHCPLGFPRGAILKGNLIPFKIAPDAIRPGQVVMVRTACGRTVARFFCNSWGKKVVAIVRAVFLPTVALSSSRSGAEVSHD